MRVAGLKLPTRIWNSFCCHCFTEAWCQHATKPTKHGSRTPGSWNSGLVVQPQHPLRLPSATGGVRCSEIHGQETHSHPCVCQGTTLAKSLSEEARNPTARNTALCWLRLLSVGCVYHAPRCSQQPRSQPCTWRRRVRPTGRKKKPPNEQTDCKKLFKASIVKSGFSNSSLQTWGNTGPHLWGWITFRAVFFLSLCTAGARVPEGAELWRGGGAQGAPERSTRLVWESYPFESFIAWRPKRAAPAVQPAPAVTAAAAAAAAAPTTRTPTWRLPLRCLRPSVLPRRWQRLADEAQRHDQTLCALRCAEKCVYCWLTASMWCSILSEAIKSLQPSVFCSAFTCSRNIMLFCLRLETLVSSSTWCFNIGQEFLVLFWGVENLETQGWLAWSWRSRIQKKHSARTFYLGTLSGSICNHCVFDLASFLPTCSSLALILVGLLARFLCSLFWGLENFEDFWHLQRAVKFCLKQKFLMTRGSASHCLLEGQEKIAKNANPNKKTHLGSSDSLQSQQCGVYVRDLPWNVATAQQGRFTVSPSTCPKRNKIQLLSCLKTGKLKGNNFFLSLSRWETERKQHETTHFFCTQRSSKK